MRARRYKFWIIMMIGAATLAACLWLWFITAPGSVQSRAASDAIERAVDAGDAVALRIAVDSNGGPNAAIYPCDAGLAIDSALGYAVLKEQAESIDILLNLGSDPTQSECPTAFPPLILAITTGYVPAIDAFIRRGIDVNYRDPTRDRSLLTIAVQYGRTNVAKYLLQHGADPDYKPRVGPPPILIASGSRYESGLLELLLDWGADAFATDDQGQTSLHFASDAATARILIDAGIDPNAKAADGSTPLHTAVGNPDVLAVLIEAGAVKGEKNSKGKTAFDIAQARRLERRDVPESTLTLLRTQPVDE